MRSKSRKDVVRLPRFYSNRYTEEPKGAPSDASHTHSGGELDKEGSHPGKILTSLRYPHLPLTPFSGTRSITTTHTNSVLSVPVLHCSAAKSHASG